MRRQLMRAGLAASLVVSLVGLGSVSSGAGAGTAVQGVTDGEIQAIVIVPDLDTLRARGFNFPPQLTTDFYRKQLAGYFDALGPINGRKVTVKAVGWDPLDATSFTKACQQATLDNKPFFVVNASGFAQSSLPCITVDNDTPFVIGDPSSLALYEASGKNLVSLALPGEVAARTSVDLIAKEKLIPKTAKIGIWSNNRPEIKATGDTLEAELEKRGYDVVGKVEVNGLASDNNILQRESSAAVNTLKANGADTVFVVQSFAASLASFWDEAARTNAGFKYFGLDGGADTCTQSNGQRAPATATGIQCITTNDHGRVDVGDTKLRADNAFEAKCRQQSDGFMGEKSTVGNSSITTINGVTYNQDVPFNQCTIAYLLHDAMKKAGKKLTWDKVYKNLMATTSGPMAYMSDGEGGFAKNKPYFANQVHLVTLKPASEATPKDANGLFGGCPVPRNCWVPSLINGQEWYQVNTKSST